VATEHTILTEVLRGLAKPPALEGIWVADDNADVRLLLCRAFKRCGTTSPIQFFCDGADVVEQLRKAEHLPKVLLLDVEMPSLDGIQTIKTLRREGYLERTNVIMFSTLNDAATISAAYSTGAKLFVPKPTRGEEYRDLARLCGELADQIDPIG